MPSFLSFFLAARRPTPPFLNRPFRINRYLPPPGTPTRPPGQSWIRVVPLCGASQLLHLLRGGRTPPSTRCSPAPTAGTKSGGSSHPRRDAGVCGFLRVSRRARHGFLKENCETYGGVSLCYGFLMPAYTVYDSEVTRMRRYTTLGPRSYASHTSLGFRSGIARGFKRPGPPPAHDMLISLECRSAARPIRRNEENVVGFGNVVAAGDVAHSRRASGVLAD